MTALFPEWERGTPVVGVVHLPPRPGSPGYDGEWRRVLDAALRDADALVAGGARGILVENFGDVPGATRVRILADVNVKHASPLVPVECLGS